jgi:hypothetical protein
MFRPQMLPYVIHILYHFNIVSIYTILFMIAILYIYFCTFLILIVL